MSDAAGLIPTTTAKPETAAPAEATPPTPAKPATTWRPSRANHFAPDRGPLTLTMGRGSETGLAMIGFELAGNVEVPPLEEVYEPIKDTLRAALAGSEEFERLTSLRSQEADSSRRKHAANERLVRLIGERAAAVAKAGAGLGKVLVKLDSQIAKAKEDLAEVAQELDALVPLRAASAEAVGAALQAQAASAAQQERDILAARRNAAALEAIEALCQAAGPLTKFAVLDLTIGRYFSSVRELALEAMVSRLADGDVQPPAKPTVAAHRPPAGVTTTGSAVPESPPAASISPESGVRIVPAAAGSKPGISPAGISEPDGMLHPSHPLLSD